MDADKYLLRIGCSGPVTPTLETLQHIHLRHLLSVPFENLTFHSGGEIIMELPWIYDKIVHQRRGGICFENNWLFSWLLSQLGFEVILLSGHVKRPESGFYGPPFDHCVIMVTLKGHRWLCDVGFGSSFEVPISLETNEPQKQDHGVFRIRCEGETLFLERIEEAQTSSSGDDGNREEMVQENGNNNWTALYKFTLQPRQWDCFTATHNYHKSSPSSLFYCKSLCTLLRPNGRVTYMGRKLILTNYPNKEGGQTTKSTLELTDEEIPGVLREKFGIVLSSDLYPKDDDLVPPSVIY